MATHRESPLDELWKEYGAVFRDFDDLTLARWMSQTLGQLEGRVWRLSHPLLGAYRLAAQVAHQRQVWLKRLTNPPSGYSPSECCRAPSLPLLTRDVRDCGLVCQHCNETLVSFEDLPPSLKEPLGEWAGRYEPVHAVAHWDEEKQKSAGNYDGAYEDAAQAAEKLLAHAGFDLAPRCLGFYPAIVWEDQDECLEVRPENVLG